MPNPYQERAYRTARKRLRGQPCYYCGQPGYTVEHLKPVSQGGTNTPSNLVSACETCNYSRGQRLSVAARRRNNREKGRRRW